jgi:hypothetical protein
LTDSLRPYDEGSTDFSLGEMQRAASDFVGQLKPADRVTVISFDDSIDVQARDGYVYSRKGEEKEEGGAQPKERDAGAPRQRLNGTL